jgi:hypothetical protein
VTLAAAAYTTTNNASLVAQAPAAAGGFTVTWVAVPGKTYQVLSGDSLGGNWSILGPPIAAGNGQGTLSYTDASATNAAQRSYRVKLLN